MFVCIVLLSYPSRTYETGNWRDVRKNTLVRVSVLLLDRSLFRSADSSDCLVEDSGVGVSGCSGDSHGNYSRVTTTNIESLSRSFSRALGLSGNLSFHAGSRTYVAHPFLKSPPYPPPRLSAIIYFRPLSRLNGREIAAVLRELDSLVYGDFTAAIIWKRMPR